MVTKAQSITAINVGTSKAQTNKLLRYGNDGLGLGNNGMQDDVEELGLQLSDDRKKRWVGLQESGSEDMCLEGYEFQVGPSFSTNKISSPDRVPMLLAEPAMINEFFKLKCQGPGNPRAVRALKELVLGRGGGLAVLWRSSASVSLLGYSNNHIDLLVVEANNFIWRFTGYYGLPDRNRKRESWNLLRALSRQSALPWVCMEDYNDMLCAEEKRGRVLHPNSLFQGFREAVEDCKLTDIPLIGYPFTWERGRVEIRDCHNKFDVLRHLDDEHSAIEFKNCTDRFARLLAQEEDSWRQRAKYIGWQKGI
ncbi:hypothetical protein POTOM_007068 [Populus tomentosa]|uniref:Endonuclease/exonuclease/phosphatase domain-containing protein n=1 Tax=Populus tomentosa TaxID=118781 RepID=A0A8X8AF22_POPTO|nr:hypothetical protein POTOM_007068 [Populus tomentosa]